MKVQTKILIVDDEPIILLYIEEILSVGGDYLVRTVTSGEDVLGILPVFKPDLILLDIQLPGMSGYEVCKAIRADAAYRFTKILMISGHAKVDERLKGYDVGADDYIAKPFDKEELLAKVRVFAQLKNKEEVDQIKGDLLTLITHETRTPVSGIIGCAELLAQDATLPAETHELAELIVKSGHQLFQFMKNAVLLCKLKAGIELHLNTEPVSEMLINIINKFMAGYPDKNISLIMEMDDELILSADWSLLADVFRFVFANACKFSPEGGVVKINTQEKNGVLEVRVSDEGDGIDPAIRHQIFDEFAIKDVEHHRKGQGISLAICRHVLMYHHGSIHAEDNESGGATFVIKIPMIPVRGIDAE